jgi:hypothetical protein
VSDAASDKTPTLPKHKKDTKTGEITATLLHEKNAAEPTEKNAPQVNSVETRQNCAKASEATKSRPDVFRAPQATENTLDADLQAVVAAWPSLPPELLGVVAAWPSLPANVRAAIQALAAVRGE